MTSIWIAIILLLIYTPFNKADSDLQTCYDDCGNDPSLFTLADRSFGGSPSPEYRFTGLLEIFIPGSIKNYTGFCTASIVGRNWILLAKHCLEVPIRLMKEYGVSTNEYPPYSINLHFFAYPEHIKFYPALDNKENRATAAFWNVDIYEFVPRKPYENSIDLCMIKLTTPLIFSKSLQSICLLKNNGFSGGKTVFSTGYGRRSKLTDNIPQVGDEIVNGTIPMKVELKLYSYETCNKIIDPGSSDVTCAEIQNKSLLEGDSGGPLYFEYYNRYYQIATTDQKDSYIQSELTAENLAGQKFPDLFTNISSSCGWISKITNNEVQCKTTTQGISQKCRNKFLELRRNATNSNIFGSGAKLSSDNQEIAKPHKTICELLGLIPCNITVNCKIQCKMAEDDQCSTPINYENNYFVLDNKPIQFKFIGRDVRHSMVYAKNGSPCGRKDKSECIDSICRPIQSPDMDQF